MPNESFALTWWRRHKVSLRRILTQQARSGKQSRDPCSGPSTGSKNYLKCVSKRLSTWLANRTAALFTGQSWRVLKSCYSRWYPEQLGFRCWISLHRPHNLNAWNRLGLKKRCSFVSDAGLNGLNLRGGEQNLKNNLKSIILFRFEIPMVTKMAPPDIFCRGLCPLRTLSLCSQSILVGVSRAFFFRWVDVYVHTGTLPKNLICDVKTKRMMVWVSHFANFFSFIVGRCFVRSLKGYYGIVLTFFIRCEELRITYYMHSTKVPYIRGRRSRNMLWLKRPIIIYRRGDRRIWG